MKIFKPKKKTSISETTLIDVRSRNGFKNHLITYRNYLVSREALCGSTQWLLRGGLGDGSWLIHDVNSLNSEHYCSNCLKNARKSV